MKLKMFASIGLLSILLVSGLSCGAGGTTSTGGGSSGCYKTECHTDTEPYTATEVEDLTYITWGDDASESWWDGDVWIQINVRNTDSQGGYFTVDFQCYYGNGGNPPTWHEQSEARYLGPDETQNVKVEFSKGMGASWSWNSPVVTPPTKTVTEIKYHEVQHCDQVWHDVCY